MALDFSDFTFSCKEFFDETINTVVIYAGAGYMGARVFTSLDPMQGLCFGVICGLIKMVIDPIFKVLLRGINNTPIRKLMSQFSVLALEVGIVYGLMKGIGYPLSLKSIIGLTLAQIPVAIIGSIGFVTLTLLAYGVYKVSFQTMKFNALSP